MSQDPLTDIVRSMNLTGAVFLNAEFSAPWSITAHVTEEDCRPFFPMPKQVIAYHVVVDGFVLMSLQDKKGRVREYRAEAGDIIFLPGNPLHVLASTSDLIPVSGDDLLLPPGADGLIQIKHGGGGEPARILCGFMGSGAASMPLIDALPEVLIISIDNLEKRRWIEASVFMAAREFARGQMLNSTTVCGLCQLLLTEALRVHVERDTKPSGWLAGMAHPRIAVALSKIHNELDNPPSVERLASDAGMSRSAFVDRFTSVMGIGPRRYILLQRMNLAKELIQDGQMNIAEIAFEVGYDAPEAFSRAFKREIGWAPADWRKQLGQPI